MSRQWVRDASVDAAWALFALAAGLTSEQNVLLGAGERSVPLRVADVALGLICFASIWFWRRRRPVTFAVAAIVIGIVSTLAGGVGLVGVFTVAQRRPWRTSVAVSLLAAACIVPALALYPVPHAERALAVGVLSTFAATGWGMYVRTRAQLLASLRQQVADADRAAAASAAAAQRAERTRIAREMHDVLAHRLSLLAVHAGALEYHRGASTDEVDEIAGIIRHNSHQALEELRQVISLLREHPDAGRPSPSLSDLPELVEESRSAGLEITCSLPSMAEGLQRIPATTGRTAYRIVQEALTNVRKHAPHARVRIDVADDGGGLQVSVHNTLPVPTGRRAAAAPGSGTGLLGLRERVTLLGGRIEHGPTGEEGFALRAWLPYDAPDWVPS
ncbi:sensor histidine kinase [Nocardioides ultimimeridianus]